MTAWYNITEAETDPGAPPKSELWKAWWKNPIALGEGASGAPYSWFSWHPYNGETVGDGIDGAIYDFAEDGAVASVASPAFAEGFEYRFVFDAVSTSATATIGFTAAYSVGGSSGNIVFTGSVSATVNMSGYIDIERAGISERVKFWRQGQLTNNSGTALEATATPGNLSEIRRSGTPTRISSVTFAPGSGNFDAGKILMMKRRVYV